LETPNKSDIIQYLSNLKKGLSVTNKLIFTVSKNHLIIWLYVKNKLEKRESIELTENIHQPY
jgi:hypothetical protein